MTRISTAFSVIALLGITTACLDDGITGTRPLSFSITANPTTATVDQDVAFSVSATGTGLRLVTIDFGDGTADTLRYSGPVEIGDQAIHRYSTVGTFDVRGEAFADVGSASEQITITVN